MSSTAFKGALKAKRKPDLLDIASHLGLELAENTKRDDVETAVRDYLLANRDALSADVRVSGLYSSLNKSERKGRVNTAGLDSESDSNGSPQISTESPQKHTRVRQPPRRSEPVPITSRVNGLAQPAAVAEEAVVNATSSLGSNLKLQTRKSLDNIANVFKSSTSAIRSDVDDVAAEADQARHTAVRSTRAFNHAIETKLKRKFDQARAYASDSGNLVRILISIEAFFLVLSVLPTHYIRLGQPKTESFLRHGLKGGDSVVRHWIIAVPDAQGLITMAFWRPLLLWTLWAVALPSLAAHLVTFQRRAEPSPVTFSLTRLALLLFFTGASFTSSGLSWPLVPDTLGVAAGQPSSAATSSTYAADLTSALSAHFSYIRWVPLDASLQILATSLIAGLSLYEVVAVRHRAA